MEITKDNAYLAIAALKQCAEEHQNEEIKPGNLSVVEVCTATVELMEGKGNHDKETVVANLLQVADEHHNEWTPTFNICVEPMCRDIARYLVNPEENNPWENDE